MNSLSIQQQNKDDIEMSLLSICWADSFVIDFAAFIGKCKYQIESVISSCENWQVDILQ